MNEVRQMRARWHAEWPDLDTSPVEIVARVRRLAKFFDSAASLNMESYGLTGPTWAILGNLRTAGPLYELTPSELQRRLSCPSGLMTNRLNRLEAEGYVERRADPSDGRGVLVRLTQRGVNTVDELLPIQLDAQRRLTETLRPDEQAQLATLLDTMLLHLERERAIFAESA